MKLADFPEKKSEKIARRVGSLHHVQSNKTEQVFLPWLLSCFLFNLILKSSGWWFAKQLVEKRQFFSLQNGIVTPSFDSLPVRSIFYAHFKRYFFIKDETKQILSGMFGCCLQICVNLFSNSIEKLKILYSYTEGVHFLQFVACYRSRSNQAAAIWIKQVWEGELGCFSHLKGTFFMP